MKVSLSSLNGVVAIDKPTGVTSAFVVAKIKKLLQTGSISTSKDEATLKSVDSQQKHGRAWTSRHQVKVGHGGTLDPLATGVLVIGIGRGTKALGQLLDCEKEYLVTGKLGTATNTYDSEGQPTHTEDYGHITRELLELHLEKFRGPILQTPPIYSALKRQGKPLHEYARENLPLPPLDPRPVTIHELEVTDFSTTSPFFSLRVKCSKGTYIRSLVHDLGLSMTSRAHVTQLRRTCQGEWKEEDLLDFESITFENIVRHLRPVSEKIVEVPSAV